MTEKHVPVTGGCLCGELRYESSSPPVDGGFCHCRMCQKASGGLSFPWVEFAPEGFRITKGEPKFFRSSEWLQRGACSICGCPVIVVYDDNPTLVIMVGSLDHPDDWPLTQSGWSGHAFVDDKVAWNKIADNLPQHAQNYPDIPEGQGGTS